jgi:hypothetical protein
LFGLIIVVVAFLQQKSSAVAIFSSFCFSVQFKKGWHCIRLQFNIVLTSKTQTMAENRNQENQQEPGRRSNRGFASMDPQRQREIASEGGRAAHKQGVAHEWSSEEAREAGRKGGQNSRGGGRSRRNDTSSNNEGER